MACKLHTLRVELRVEAETLVVRVVDSVQRTCMLAEAVDAVLAFASKAVLLDRIVVAEDLVANTFCKWCERGLKSVLEQEDLSRNANKGVRYIHPLGEEGGVRCDKSSHRRKLDILNEALAVLGRSPLWPAP